VSSSLLTVTKLARDPSHNPRSVEFLVDYALIDFDLLFRTAGEFMGNKLTMLVVHLGRGT